MSELHPAGNDEDEQPRKDLCPPPVGTAESISNDRDPLVKMLLQIAGTQDAILQDYLLLVNRDGGPQLLRLLLENSSPSGARIAAVKTRMSVEDWKRVPPREKVHSNLEIVKDHNGEDHPPRDAT